MPVSTPQPGQSSQQSRLPQDPTKHLTSHPGPANPASENQQADQQAMQARQAADQQTLQKLQGIYVYTHKTDPGCVFPYEGVCLCCGWHTLELSEDAAKLLVNAHIAIHWRDLVSGIHLGVGLPTANLRLEAMQAQEQGAVKGGQQALKPVQQKEQQQQQQFDQLAQQLAQQSSSSSTQSSGG